MDHLTETEYFFAVNTLRNEAVDYEDSLYWLGDASDRGYLLGGPSYDEDADLAAPTFLPSFAEPQPVDFPTAHIGARPPPLMDPCEPWRCLDASHEASCTTCTQPPPQHEAEQGLAPHCRCVCLIVGILRTGRVP